MKSYTVAYEHNEIQSWVPIQATCKKEAVLQVARLLIRQNINPTKIEAFQN